MCKTTFSFRTSMQCIIQAMKWNFNKTFCRFNIFIIVIKNFWWNANIAPSIICLLSDCWVKSWGPYQQIDIIYRKWCHYSTSHLLWFTSKYICRWIDMQSRHWQWNLATIICLLTFSEGRNLDNVLFKFWEKRWLDKFILKLTDL